MKLANFNKILKITESTSKCFLNSFKLQRLRRDKNSLRYSHLKFESQKNTIFDKFLSSLVSSRMIYILCQILLRVLTHCTISFLKYFHKIPEFAE